MVRDIYSLTKVMGSNQAMGMKQCKSLKRNIIQQRHFGQILPRQLQEGKGKEEYSIQCKEPIIVCNLPNEASHTRIECETKVLGISIGCIIAKTNIHVWVVGYNVQTCFKHLYNMLDTMFQHPSTVQCALFHACLFARLILFKETIFPYLIDQATRISLQNQLCFYSQRINNSHKGYINNSHKGYDWKF